ncbi:MAG TPA: hypothetical protein VF298_01755 [Bacteroidales bacterium]
MERHTLSKSTFIRGVQCLKSLFFYKKRYFLRDPLSQEQQAVFSRGTNVGVLARQLFPGGKDATPASPFLYARSVALTTDWIAKGEQVIYEAAFQHDKVLVMLDILIHTPAGWIGIEVKSSRSVSETHLLDAALQYYVITGSGLPLADIRIIHIDSDYTRGSEIELEKLFISHSVLEQVLSRQDYIREQIQREKEVILLPHAPSIPVGLHCHNPYTCDFIGHCWKNYLRPSIFDLDAFSPEEQQKHFNAGFQSLEQLAGLPEINRHQQMQIDSQLSGEMFLDKDALKAFINLNETPFTYLIVLNCRPALPLYAGTRPYELLPYAFVLLSGEPGSAPYVFIAPSGINPGIAFAEQLKSKVTTFRTLLVSGQALEVSSELDKFHPKVGVIDLLTPFKERMIYHPGLVTGQRLAEITGHQPPGTIPDKGSSMSDTMAGVRYLALADALEGESYNQELAEIGRFAAQCVSEMVALHHWLTEQARE